MKERAKKEIGWYNESIDHFLCASCFSKIEVLNKKDYKPVYIEDLKDYIFSCDACKKEIKIEKEETNLLKKEKIKSKRNKLAIGGLILGVTSIFFSFIGIIPLLAIIFSAIGLCQVKGQKENDRILAIVGLILGIVYTLVNMRIYGHI